MCIRDSLERGAIDATEWIGPHDDESMGLYQVASYYYYPGWWEPGVTLGLLINIDDFNALPPAYQQVLHSVGGETFCERLAAYDWANPPALQRLIQDHGVIITPYSEDVMEAAWRESHSYLDELSASNPEFRQIYDSYRTFRDAQWSFVNGNELTYQQWVIPRIG